MRRLKTGVCLGVVALAAACSGGESEDVAVPSTEASVVSTTARPSTSTTADEAPAASTSPAEVTAANEQELVVARYLAYEVAVADAWALEPPDPEAPALAEYAVDAQLELISGLIRATADAGQAIRDPGGPNEKRRVVIRSIDETTAILGDCVIDDAVVYVIATDETVDADVVTYSREATMVKVAGKWRVQEIRRIQQWDGEAGCALADDFA